MTYRSHFQVAGTNSRAYRGKAATFDSSPEFDLIYISLS